MTDTDRKPLHPAEIAKLEAEKAKLEAERDEVRAKIDTAAAERAKAEAEARKLSAEAAECEADAAVAAINLRSKQRAEAKELAGDEHHFTYVFDKEVSEASVRACKAQLFTWVRTSSEPITVELVIDSPGGSVFDGFHLIDAISVLHAQGHTINTTAFGMAASMAGVLLQVGQRRAMGSNSMLLIHEASFGASGSFGKVEDQVKLVKKMQDRIITLFASRAAGSEAESPMSKKSIATRWSRTDWWVDSTECLKYGFVDEVL